MCVPDPSLSVEQLNTITSAIINAAIRIHRTVGPGVLEKAYFDCLCFELSSAGIYRGVKIDCAYRGSEETLRFTRASV